MELSFFIFCGLNFKILHFPEFADCGHFYSKWFKIMVKKTKTGRITIDSELCKGCYLCISVCPHDLLKVSDELNQKGYYPAEFIETDLAQNSRKCTGCATCAIICPDIAIEVYRD